MPNPKMNLNVRNLDQVVRALRTAADLYMYRGRQAQDLPVEKGDPIWYDVGEVLVEAANEIERML